VLILRYKKLTSLFAIISLLYVIQAVFTQPDQATLDKYHVSAGQLQIMILTIAIPLLIIWFISLVGYLRFRAYTTAIGKSKDGAAFSRISTGILWFTLWLPVTSLIDGVLTHYYHVHPSATANVVRLINYFNILILLPAFILINQGAMKLLPLVKRPATTMSQGAVLLFIALSALYVFLTLHDPARSVATKGAPTAAYYLTDSLIVTTIIIPRLIMWFLGLQAVYFIYLYRLKVKGAIYRQSLTQLAAGLAGIIVTIIALRCFESLSPQLNELSLAGLLLIIYALLSLLAVAYILLAKGARQLLRIEEL
jgi:hypothetical protein